jgi:hypothetical protein
MTISDLMVLIAATAISLVGARFMLSLLELPPASWGVSALLGSVWVALVMTLVLIPLRLREPHPPIGTLWCQPGWLACNAVALTLVISLFQQLLNLVEILVRTPTGLPANELFKMSFREVTYRLPYQTVIAISAAWATLALVGAWEAEKGWFDRAGRLFGLYWLAFPVLNWVVGIMS